MTFRTDVVIMYEFEKKLVIEKAIDEGSAASGIKMQDENY